MAKDVDTKALDVYSEGDAYISDGSRNAVALKTPVAADAGNATQCLLQQFAREPVPGQVKTRLIPHLSAEQACEVHCELVRCTAQQLLAAELGRVELHVAGSVQHPAFDACARAGVAQVTQQRGADLGERMLHALVGGLARAAKVLLVGSDCPGIDPDYLQRASRALEDYPVVIGPAKDGGFVLIGAAASSLNALSPELFAGVHWGGSDVFSATMGNMQRLGVECHVLPPLADIDRPEDLALWEAHACREGWPPRHSLPQKTSAQ